MSEENKNVNPQNPNQNPNPNPVQPPPPPPQQQQQYTQQQYAQQQTRYQYNYGQVQYAPYVPVTRKQHQDYESILSTMRTPKSFILLIFAFVFGVLFSDLLLRGGSGGIAVPVVTALFYIMTAWYFTGVGSRPMSKGAYALMLPIFLVAICVFVYDNRSTNIFNIILLGVLIPVQLTAMSGSSLSELFSASQILDSIVSWLGTNFYYFDMPSRSIGNAFGKENKGVAKTIFKVLLGIAFATPLASVFIMLFADADKIFGDAVARIIEKIDIDFGALIFDVVFGAAVAYFLVAVFISVKGKKPREQKNYMPKGVFDSLFIVPFLAVICAIHVLFIVVQFKYLFFGNNAQHLPGDINPAIYARNGFFQLATSSVLVFFVLIAILLLTKRRDDKFPMGVRIMTALFIVCNLAVSASAIKRMMLYIDTFDLTVMRLNISWFIVLLALFMIAILVRLFISKVKLPVAFGSSVIVMILILNVLNAGNLVAKVNVDRYLRDAALPESERSSIVEVDTYYLSRLGPAASAHTARLLDSEHVSDKLKADAKYALEYQRARLLSKSSWRNFRINDIIANNIYEKYGVKKMAFSYYGLVEYEENNKYDAFGYDHEGYDRDGYDRGGYDRDGEYKYTSSGYYNDEYHG